MKKKQDFYESTEFFDNFIDNVSPELGEHPCGLVLAPLGFLPERESYDLGRAKGHDELRKFLEQSNITPPHTRADKGKKHRKRPKRISEYGMTAEIVAEEFNLAAQTLEKGAQKVGKCDEGKIKLWDIKYPDAKHKNKWGYHAELRLLAKNKTEYEKVLRYWSAYWQDYKQHFLKWRKQHPASKRSSFRFKPLVRINDFHPEWIGRDDKGEFYNTPKKQHNRQTE